MDEVERLIITSPQDPSRLLVLWDRRTLSDTEILELQEWAVQAAELSASDQRSLLDAVLSYDSLAVAAVSGVVGNAAWSVFPAAAKRIHERFSRKPIDAVKVTESVRATLAAITPDIDSLRFDAIEHEASGIWHVKASTLKESFDIRTSPSADVFEVRRKDR